MRLSFIAAAAMLASGCSEPGDGVLLGTLERDRVELVAEAQEPIVAVLVREGDRVAAGQPMLRLDPSTTESRLSQARATVGGARAALAEQVTGPRREEILAARARLAGAEARLATSGREYERVAELVRRVVAAAERPRPAARTTRNRRSGSRRRARVAARARKEFDHEDHQILVVVLDPVSGL